ncbi:MAG: DUF1294 domain-containing protein [Clostridia bacterium]|nr:DUF1294 domain-containing protein [Clostridia bacterium]
MLRYLLIFYAVVSLIAFFAYGRDKRKAKKKAWRTPEAVLLGLGFFGGAAGALLGMSLFRHKTKHILFWLVNLLGLAAQIALAYFVYTL